MSSLSLSGTVVRKPSGRLLASAPELTLQSPIGPVRIHRIIVHTYLLFYADHGLRWALEGDETQDQILLVTEYKQRPTDRDRCRFTSCVGNVCLRPLFPSCDLLRPPYDPKITIVISINFYGLEYDNLETGHQIF